MRARHDRAFWDIVDDLEWKLDDGSAPPPPPQEPEFDHGGGGGGGAWPIWATHVVAFLLGGLTWAALMVAPPLLPLAAFLGIVTLIWAGARRGWR